ncbi:MAG: carbohydrate-binding domain-containing protein [Lachnospiraceae bacterium]|nr:carbohydrate-binding domain-containing protein [Lachnospiraceae bacterium]
MNKRILKKAIASLTVLSMVASLAAVPGTAEAKKKIKLNKSKVTIKVGKKVTLKLKNAKKKKVKWKSKNKKIATVTKKGVVKGKKKGKTTIIATYKGKKYKCKVTVKKAAASSSPSASSATSASPTASAVVSASPSASDATSASPAASASPATSTSPEASAEASASPEASTEASVSPSASASPEESETPVENVDIALKEGMEVTQDETDGKYTVKTNKSGVLKVEFLLPGEYTLSSEEAINARIVNTFTTRGELKINLNGLQITTDGVDPDKGVINLDEDVTKTTIFVPKDTTNTIVNNGATGTDSTETEEYEDGTIGPKITYPIGIQAKNEVTFEGEDKDTSKLNVISPNGDGVKIKSTGGALYVNTLELNVAGSVDDFTVPTGHNGISAKQSIDIYDSNIKAAGANSGLKTTLDADDVPSEEEIDNLGIYVSDSTANIVSLKNGISCAYEIENTEGKVVESHGRVVLYCSDVNITVTGDNASKAIDTAYASLSGHAEEETDEDGNTYDESLINIESDAKGIDAFENVYVDNISVEITSVKNAIDTKEAVFQGSRTHLNLTVSKKNGIAADVITFTDNAGAYVVAADLAFKNDDCSLSIAKGCSVYGLTGVNAVSEEVTSISYTVVENPLQEDLESQEYVQYSGTILQEAAIIVTGDGDQINKKQAEIEAVNVFYSDPSLENYENVGIEVINPA